MAVTFHTLTGDVTDILGVDFPLDRVTGATLETNLARDQALVAGSTVRLPGVGKVDVQADGTFSVANLVASNSADTNVDPDTPLLYRLNIRYRHPQAARGRNVIDVPVWSSPWFELNGSGTTTLADVVEVAYLPASLISQATATLEAARDDAVSDVQAAGTSAALAATTQADRAETEADRAQQAAEDAVDISGIDTSDGVVSALVAGTAGAGPATRAALSAQYGPKADPMTAAFAPREGAVYHDFRNKPDGPAPTVTDSGHPAFVQHNGSAGQNVPYVQDGTLRQTPVTTPSASYWGVELPSETQRVAWGVIFPSGAGSMGKGTVANWTEPLQVGVPGGIAGSNIHLVFDDDEFSYEVIDEPFANPQLRAGTYPALAPDVEHVFEIVLDVPNDRAYLYVNGSRVAMVTDTTADRIKLFNGYLPTLEHFTPDPTYKAVRFTRFMADPKPAGPLASPSKLDVLRAPVDAPRFFGKTWKPAANVSVNVPQTTPAEVSANLRLPVVFPESGLLAVHLEAFISPLLATDFYWQVMLDGGSNLGNVQVLTNGSGAARRYADLIVQSTPGRAANLHWFHFAVAANSGTFRADNSLGRAATITARAVDLGSITTAASA